MADVSELLAAEALRQQPNAAPPFEQLVRTRRLRDRRNRIASGTLLLLAVAGAGSIPALVGTERPPTNTAATAEPAGSVTTRLTLPATTLRSGESLSAQITVDNDTGQPIQLTGCGPIYRVLLAEPGHHPTASWPLCAIRITIPTGKSTYPVHVSAAYSECSTNGTQGMPACLPDGSMPGLPAGRYDVITSSVAPNDVPVPAPTSITVTP